VIDVSNPELSMEVNAIDTPGEVSDIEVMGGLAYVTDVNATTPIFGTDGAPFARWRGPHFEGVKEDGLADLLAHLPVEKTVYGDRVVCLAGEADHADCAQVAISLLFICDSAKFAAVRGSVIEAAFLARTDNPEFG
jgi:hypothetical protein